jgi:formylmethanofuran dehydrogenase subunit B
MRGAQIALKAKDDALSRASGRVKVMTKVALSTDHHFDGVHRSGTAYRMDEIPIPLRQFLSSPLRSDDEVLAAIHSSLRERATSA